MAVAVKEQRINITLKYDVIDRLKELARQKKIVSMNKFCQEAVEEKLLQFEREQKRKLMEFAAKDPEYLARCREIESDFAQLDGLDTSTRGNEEW